MLQHLLEYNADLLFQNLFHIFCCESIFFFQFLYPVGMFFQNFIFSQIFACHNGFAQTFKFTFQTCRKHCQAHNFDQTDVFFLDMVQFRMRMINTQRMFFGRNIIPQNQIHLIHITTFSCDRGDGIVWFSVGFREDKCCLVSVSSPL